MELGDLIWELWILYGPSGSNMEIVDLIWVLWT